MAIERLDHVNVQTRDLEATRDFYVDVIGLRVGDRPPFNVPGYWLYDECFPVIHLNESDSAQAPLGGAAVDHIAFRAAGLAAMRERIARHAIEAYETIVPRTGEAQIFLCDPNGVRIELNFAAAEARSTPQRGRTLRGQTVTA